MSDQTAPGEARPGYEMTIERGKVREFARATKSDHPAYLEDAAPVIPPTFLTAASFWAPRPGQGPGAAAAAAGQRSGAGGAGGGGAGGGGRNMARVLHGGQEYVFHGPPPRAGTQLTVTSRLADTYEREGKRGGKMRFSVTVTEFRDPEGNLVAEGKSTGIVTERAPTQEGQK